MKSLTADSLPFNPWQVAPLMKGDVRLAGRTVDISKDDNISTRCGGLVRDKLAQFFWGFQEALLLKGLKIVFERPWQCAIYFL
jgi:hypothetical protein